MFENLFKRKNNEDSKLNYLDVGKKYRVKDLYVAYPGLITKGVSAGESCCIYNEEEAKIEPIIVRKIGKGQFVENVLNGREYGILFEFNYFKALKFVNQYMVNTLTPLELVLNDKSKKIITIGEIKELLYPETKKENNESNYHDAVLREINEVNNKINTSKISLTEKEEYKKMLIEIANYYVECLKDLSSYNNEQEISLNVNKKSIYTLRRECIQKLVKIELRLPTEDINDLIGELKLLEENIKKI